MEWAQPLNEMGILVQHGAGLEVSIASLRAQVSSLEARLAAAENTIATLQAALSNEMVARQSPDTGLRTPVANEVPAEQFREGSRNIAGTDFYEDP
jgi:outer membrane protein TolC